MSMNPDWASFLLDAWEKHENIAMHFNDLILRLRIQALGGIAAVVAIGGVLLKPSGAEAQEQHWGVISSVFLVLLAFWIAIWVLDFLYYNRLLTGSVDSLLALENAINSSGTLKFNMSHKIEDAVVGDPLDHCRKGPRIGPLLFYLIVFAVLAAASTYSGARALGWRAHTSHLPLGGAIFQSGVRSFVAE